MEDDLCYNCDSQNIIRSTNWMTAGISERRVTNTYSKKKMTILLVAAVAVHNVKNNEWRQVPMSQREVP